MSKASVIGRRGLLLGLAAMPIGLASAKAQSPGTAPTRFRAVTADTSDVAATGGGRTAAALAQALVPQMRKVFADLLAPGDARAPTLVARIHAVYFTSYAGGVEIDQFGQNDSIEGDGLVTSGGRTLSSTHILTELSPTYSGAFYTQGIDTIRLESIAYQFAYWLRREMSL